MLFDLRREIINIEGGELEYISNFLSEERALFYYNHFLENVEWQSDTIRIFGKTHTIPRLQAWYGDEDAKYSYSNIDLEPLPWTKELLELKKAMRPFSSEDFNSVLLNLYRTGKDSNGWHSDDEKELGPEPEIASITLGQERIFHLKHKKLALKKSLLLEHGSLLIMKGETQKNWKHQIPKTAKYVEPRINLTFRRIFP
jgi:alkylated DNA repair dioxygenase AlkB